MMLWNVAYFPTVRDISSPGADVLSNRNSKAGLRRAQNMLLPRWCDFRKLDPCFQSMPSWLAQWWLKFFPTRRNLFIPELIENLKLASNLEGLKECKGVQIALVRISALEEVSEKRRILDPRMAMEFSWPREGIQKRPPGTQRRLPTWTFCIFASELCLPLP